MSQYVTLQSITGVDIEMRIAGAGSRSYAFIIDWHIRFLLALTWLLLSGWIEFGTVRWLGRIGEGDTDGSLLTIWLPTVAIYFLYHPVLEVAMQGRSPGKRMAGVRIVTTTGDIPGPGPLLIRNLFRLIDSLPTLYMLGLAIVIFTRNNVRIGDLAAGTLLIADDSSDNRELASLHAAPGHLTPQQLDLIHDLLHRWPEIGEPTRSDIARALLAKLQPDSAANTLTAFTPRELHERLRALLTEPSP